MNAPAAYRIYETQCAEGRSSLSCRLQAEMLATGEGVERDDARAGSLYAEQCARSAARFPSACTQLALLIQQGRVEAADDTPADLLHEACWRGCEVGCAELARLYLNGEGVVEDVELARALCEHASEDPDAADTCAEILPAVTDR